MSDEQVKDAVVVETPIVETPAADEQMQIDVDGQTAFTLKMQEFEKSIAEAESNVAKIKLDRATFVYDNSVQQVVAAHKEKLIRAKVEEEARATAVPAK